jgi:hypothetical protein
MEPMRINCVKNPLRYAHAPLSRASRTLMGQMIKRRSRTDLILVEGLDYVFLNKPWNSIELYRTGGISI